MNALCQHKNHRVEGYSPGSLYCYRDSTHGIPKDIDICDECLYEHVHKYYPGGTIESVLLDRHPEWKREPVQLTLLS